MTTPPSAPGDHLRARAREAVLGVKVLEGLDLEPVADGVVIDGPVQTLVGWDDLDDTVQTCPDPSDARRLVSALLRLHILVDDLGGSATEVLAPSLRLLALPTDHVVHPGPTWVREVVLGDSLHVGVGIVDVVTGRKDCVPVPASVARRLHTDDLWHAVRLHAEEMAQIAAARLRRDGAGARTVLDLRNRMPRGVLRPVGGVDVPSLLSTSTLRSAIVADDPTGMRAAAAPMRGRGWFDLTRTDPAFVGSAWMATNPVERGLNGPVLVTAHEVAVRDHHIDLTLLEERTGNRHREG